MECHSAIDAVKEFSRKFTRRVYDERIPVSGSIDLTSRCNFRCLHCYIPEEKRRTQHSSEELDTRFILNLIDDIVEAECLNFLFTGGEPLLRHDFSEIYTYAKKKGLVITVFTNGSIITDKHVKLFRDLPPSAVDISVYGASPETYEHITGIKDSFQMVMSGIDRLHRNGVKISLKTILMDKNVHEFNTLETMARNLGVKFRFDAAINPRLDGDLAPLSRRILPETAIELEFRDPERVRLWKEFWDSQQQIRTNDRLYVCGAGRFDFHVTSDGFLLPCMMSTEPSWDLRKGRFLDGWKSRIAELCYIKMEMESPCRTCDLMSLCGYCPPFFGLENGSPTSCSDYMCRLGHLRYERITSLLNKD